jgi:murein DD-endopeptidase MepM/ murein hydrolase activator NlpD
MRLAGELRQGALLTGKTEPGTRVFFAGRPVQLGPQGGFVVGLGRQAPAEVPLAWTEPDGAFHLRLLDVAQRHYGVQRINGLPGRLVNPDDAALRRIRREQERVEAARQRFSPLSAYRRGFDWPLTGPVTGVYGTRRVLNGEPRQPHYGIDIAVPTGTVIRAPAGGVVRLVAEDLYFSGGTLILDHGHGVTSSFLHLSAFLVGEGERVAKGQAIARVGASGRVTGAHLDWRVNWFDQRLDPALLAGPMPGEHGVDSARGG